jgi:hypothetical protein
MRKPMASLVVNSDFRTPGRDDVFEKVWGDFQDKGLRLAPDEVRRKLQEFLSVAREQILPPAPGGPIMAPSRPPP